MRSRQRQSGISLTEILVVIGTMAVLMGLSIPAARQLVNSFESGTGSRQLINAALSNARAIAVRQQTYAGVRFQEDKNGHTYIIFIQHDPGYDPTKAPQPLGTDLANGFRAVTGRKPMKLPEDVGVLSGYWIDRSAFNPNNWNTLVPKLLDNTSLSDNATNLVTVGGLTRNRNLLDASIFSIVFSPQGKLTVHPVWVRNKDGKTESNSTAAISNDTIFNIMPKVDADVAMFYQDDYGDPAGINYGIGPEMSVQSFLIYSKSQYQQVSPTARWTNYLENLFLNREYISPYTGELVMEYREQTP